MSKKLFLDQDGYGEPTIFYGDPDDLMGVHVYVLQKFHLDRQDPDLWPLLTAKILGGAS